MNGISGAVAWIDEAVEISRAEYVRRMATQQIWEELMHDIIRQHDEEQDAWARVWDSIEAQRIEFFDRAPEPTPVFHSVFLRRSENEVTR